VKLNCALFAENCTVLDGGSNIEDCKNATDKKINLGYPIFDS
jgi:hypothetical protein